MFPGKHNISLPIPAGLFLAASLLLAACSSSSQPSAVLATSAPTRAGELTPYISLTPSANNTGTANASLPTRTPLPSPTPTPRTHVVKKGEDMGGIAFIYHISLEALMAANPKVKPNMMSVGTQLIIPPSKTQAGENALVDPTAGPQTPTPLPLETGPMSCTRVEDGGVWCFLPVRNSRSFPLEGVSAIFRLADNQVKTVLPQTAFLPLDTLPAGISLPLVAYFPPDQASQLAPPYQFSSELQSALPSANDGRYLPTLVDNIQARISENGLSAAITANVHLKSLGKARRVWVAAVAYDAQGNVVGVRRWEKPGDQPLESGQALAATMSVYSVSGKIDRVDLVSESRP